MRWISGLSILLSIGSLILFFSIPGFPLLIFLFLPFTLLGNKKSNNEQTRQSESHVLFICPYCNKQLVEGTEQYCPQCGLQLH